MQPDPEVLQKANLGAGEMYDMLQKRDLALAKYQAVIADGASHPAGGNRPQTHERRLPGVIRWITAKGTVRSSGVVSNGEVTGPTPARKEIVCTATIAAK